MEVNFILFMVIYFYSSTIGTYQCGPDTENLLNSPQILQEIQAARLAESKLNSLNKLVKTLLNDLPGYKDAISKITSAIKEAEMKRINLVESWVIIYIYKFKL